jgi:hypothetical protein
MAGDLSPFSSPVAIKYLDPKRFEDCLRSSGVTEAEIDQELEAPRRQADCRNRAMEAVDSDSKSAERAIQIVFNRPRYEACLAGAKP